MNKRNILWLIFSSILLLCCCSATASAAHPAQTIMEFYPADFADLNTIEPYIVCILALNEVEHARHLQEVQQFIEWYFSRLNYPDRHGLTGTIYVYVFAQGEERTTNRYDSVDGYAGLFLHLLHRYVLQTGDIELLERNWDKIEDIAYLIPLLQDEDGLTRALPDSRAKYLMDNGEAYGGLSAYLSLRDLLGKDNSKYYSRVRSSIKKGIFTQLYDDEHTMFAWAVEANVQSRSVWRRFYPDAYGQLFPIYYDLLTDRPEVQKHIWRRFTRRYAWKMQTFPIEQRIIYELTKRKMEEI